MKIATHFEMIYKTDMIKKRIANDEIIATYSVQNDSYTDDNYNGTYRQCLQWAKRENRRGADYKRIALIKLALSNDQTIICDYCYDEIDL